MTNKNAKRGQGMAEYIIITVLVAVGTIAATKTFGDAVREKKAEATEGVKTMEQGGVKKAK